jgi:hypothetical protein
MINAPIPELAGGGARLGSAPCRRSDHKRTGAQRRISTRRTQALVAAMAMARTKAAGSQ